MLHVYDALFTILHLLIVFFNLFGWTNPKTLRAHLIVAALTIASRLILGIWYGIGYCPITDWQWQIKEQLGETNLPDSFIKYLFDKITGKSIDPVLTDWLTGIGFGIAIVISVWLNIRHRKNRRKP